MLHEVSDPVDGALIALAARSAAPDRVALAFARLASELPDELETMIDRGEPAEHARAFVAVVAASDSLGRFCITERRAHQVLRDLDRPVDLDPADEHSVALVHRLDVLRIAARDLLGLDTFDEVTLALSSSASRVLEASVELSGESSRELAVIGMGKLGGGELNYASDVDFVFVTAPSADDDRAKRVVAAARHSFRVDTDLRPEGRAGPLTRTLDGYQSYWGRWAQTLGIPGTDKGATSRRRPRARIELLRRGAECRLGPFLQRGRAGVIRKLKARSEAMIVKQRALRARAQARTRRHTRRGVCSAAPPARPWPK